MCYYYTRFALQGTQYTHNTHKYFNPIVHYELELHKATFPRCKLMRE